MAEETKNKKATVKKLAVKTKKQPAKKVQAKLKLTDEEAPVKKVERTTVEEESIEQKKNSEKYYEAVGRRKESTARVRLYTKKSTDQQSPEEIAMIMVNNKPYREYFPTDYQYSTVDSPLKKLKSMNRFKATVIVNGGGISGQANAIRLGISRALVLFDKNFAKKLKRSGYLTVDARVKERRKYGLKKARKAPQWSKR